MRLESVIVIVPISVIVSEAAAMDYCVKAHCHVQRGKAAPPPSELSVYFYRLMKHGHELSLESVHSLFAVGPDVWNSLPVAVRNIDNHPAFRRALKSHLFNCAFSS